MIGALVVNWLRHKTSAYIVPNQVSAQIKHNHREKPLSNKTPTLSKSIYMGIWDGWYIKSNLYKRFSD